MQDWNGLKQASYGCTRCGLCETRQNVVFGFGREDADVMFVGEGPGSPGFPCSAALCRGHPSQ